MARRFYLSQFVGAGTDEDLCRPAAVDLVSVPVRFEADGRADHSSVNGWVLVSADVDAAQHAALVADPRITYLPFEDAAGNPLPVTAPLSQLGAARRTQIQNACEARHIPVDDLTAANTIRDLLRRLVARLLLRGILHANDFSEGLDTLVSAVPNARRAAINARLQSLGFNTSVVQGTDTIRAALRKLVMQSNPWLAAGV